MSGNKSFARSMNGINNIEINEVQFPDGSTITSASNLVQLDTTNDFTSNNSFNNNLPTSTKTPEVGDLTDVMILLMCAVCELLFLVPQLIVLITIGLITFLYF